MLRTLLAILAAMFVCMLLGASIYESIVVAPNFNHNIPASLEHIRGFYTVANPGSYFRILAPATQLSMLLALIVFWRDRRLRWWYLAAFLCVVAADMITFGFHYPRNDVLFVQPMQSAEAMTKVAREWATGNYARIALVLVAAVCALRNLQASGVSGPRVNASATI